jgi:hypothetical protein
MLAAEQPAALVVACRGAVSKAVARAAAAQLAAADRQVAQADSRMPAADRRAVEQAVVVAEAGRSRRANAPRRSIVNSMPR